MPGNDRFSGLCFLKIFSAKEGGLAEKDQALRTLVFQLEEVCGINVVVHKMKNVSGGI